MSEQNGQWWGRGGQPYKGAPEDPQDSPVAQKIREKLQTHQERVDAHNQRLANRKEQLEEEKKVHHMRLDEQAAALELTLHPKINPVSQRLQRDGKIEDILQRTGQAYQEKRERLQEEKLRSELEVLADPKISDLAKSLERDMKVEDRLSIIFKEQQKRLEAMRQAQIEELAQDGATFSPEISKLAKSLERPGRVEDLSVQWLRLHEEKLAQERAHLAEEEVAEVTGSPQINAKSQKMVSKMRNRAKVPVEDQLTSTSQQKKLKNYERWEMEYLEECPGYPEITQRAANLQRPGDVADRLYNMAREKDDKLRNLQAHHDQQEKLTFTPKINKRSLPMRGPVEDELLHRDAQAQERLQARIENMIEEENRLHQPKLDKNSLRISARLRTTASDRLLTPKKRDVPRRRVDDDDNEERELTFTPKINERSKQMDSTRRKGVKLADRAEHLYQWQQKVNKKKEEARRQHEEAEMAEVKDGPNLVSRAPAAVDGHRDQDVVNRLLTWQQRKQAQLYTKQQELIEAQQVECTFKPKVDRPATAGAATGRRVDNRERIRQDVESFVQRQKKARDMRERGMPHVTGSNWTPKATVPKAFKFQHKITVKSLSRPVGHDQIEKKLQQQQQAEEAQEREASVSPETEQRGKNQDELLPPGTFSDFGAVLKRQVRGGKEPPRMSDEYIQRQREKESIEQAELEDPRPWRNAPQAKPFGRSPCQDSEREFVERMEKGHQLKSEIDVIRKSGYTGFLPQWTPDSTVARAPKFNQRSRVKKIRALDPPVPVPKKT